MTAPLASVDDLKDRLGRSLSAEEATAAEKLLADASGTFRLRSTQVVSASSSTHRVKVRGDHRGLTGDGDTVYGGRATLPQRPVTAITSVKDELGVDVAYAWQEGADSIVVAGTGRFVFVEYDHGYADGEIPDEIVGVVCRMAGRALGIPADEAGYTGETLGGYSYTIGSAAGAGAAGMLDDEVAIAEKYARVGGSARLGS